MDLTLQQKKAIESDAQRIVILSCAGSGKTTVIAGRIKRLISKGFPAESILALAFSNKAARRLKEEIGRGSSQNVKVSTFHAFGMDLIRTYHEEFGLNKKVAIIANTERKRIIKDILGNDSAIEGEVSSYIRAKKSYENSNDEKFESCYQRYESVLNEKQLVDMEDMIFLPVEKLSRDESFRRVIADKYKAIFVDEYQDTNEAQNRLLDLITSRDCNICLVGDDDQAIYEWRGAKPDYIRQKALSQEYECFRLETNFRSQGAIVKVANQIICNNENRVKKHISAFYPDGVLPYFKQLLSDNEEAEYVATEIKRLVASDKFHPSDIAVLYRNEKQNEPLILAFKKYGIKYAIKDVDSTNGYSRFISVLRAIVDSTSLQDLNYAVNFPTACFDKFVLEDAKTLYQNKTGDYTQYSSLEWMDRIFLSDIQFDQYCEEFKKRYKIITQLRLASEWSAKQIIAFLLSFYEIEDDLAKSSSEYNDILQILDLAETFEKTYGPQKLRDFLLHFSQAIEENDVEITSDVDAINLMTMHRAKGLEYKVVFIVGIQVGTFPNDYFIKTPADLEAERRLFYVAITRAQQLLYLTANADALRGKFPTSLIKHGFMAEIPNILLGANSVSESVLTTLPQKYKIIDDRECVEDINASVYSVLDEESKENIRAEIDKEKTEGEESNKIATLADLDEKKIDCYMEAAYALSKAYELPAKSRIVIIGNVDLGMDHLYKTLKMNGISRDMVDYYPFKGEQFKASKYLNNPRCIGIIVGPVAHKVPTVNARSVLDMLKEYGYPYVVDLVNAKITKNNLKNAIVKIKWHYYKTKEVIDG